MLRKKSVKDEGVKDNGRETERRMHNCKRKKISAGKTKEWKKDREKRNCLDKSGRKKRIIMEDINDTKMEKEGRGENKLKLGGQEVRRGKIGKHGNVGRKRK